MTFRSVPVLLLLSLMTAPVAAQTVTNVFSSGNPSSVSFTTSAPGRYGSAKLMWIKINGVPLANIPDGGIPLEGTNGTHGVPVPGVKRTDTIEVAVTFDLADGSGGISVIGRG